MRFLKSNWPFAEATSTARENPIHTWVATLCLTAFFSASGYALFAGEVTGSTLINNGILVLGTLALFVPMRIFNRPYIASAELRQVRIFLGLICAAAVSTAVVVFWSDRIPQKILLVCGLKTAGLVLVSIACGLAAPSYRHREITLALVLFTISEFAIVTCAYFVLGIDYNENTVGSRTSTLGLVAAACLAPLAFQAAGSGIAVLVSLFLKCRTSAVATVASLMISQIERRSRRARVALILFAILMGGFLGLFARDLQQSLRHIAKRNLGSSHPVAKFFLDDKSRAKVNKDFLDRGRPWKIAVRLIKRRPILGYGVGTEFARFKQRSHNAYLSILVEGGVLFMTGWTLFYGLAVMRLIDGSWSARYGTQVASQCMVFLLSYMILSAAVESSGIGSISTPLNLIFVFLFCWTSQWYTRAAMVLPAASAK